MTSSFIELSPGVRRSILPSGLRVVTEEMPGVRSASVGVWVGVGSRDEKLTDEGQSLHGCSHFLEHLLFKGTPERSALEISLALDAVGGEFNAYTAKEYTVFHARVLDEDLPLAIDVLGDMITSSVLTDEDVEAERDVILDELAMHDDDPDDVVHNLFAGQTWGADSLLGREIGGTEKSITELTRDQIFAFYGEYYRPQNMVIAAAGNLRHDDVVAEVEKAFGRGEFLAGRSAPASRRTGEPHPVFPGTSTVKKPFEQVNFVVGVEGLARDDDRRFALSVVTTALGGGTSSRLFQEVRERRGLAYSVYSFASSQADTGVVGVALGCLPSKLDASLEVVRAEMAAIAANGITAEELAMCQGQLRGGLVLGLEDSASRMSRLGKGELTHAETLSIDDVLDRIAAVTLEECAEVAAEIFSQPQILALVGP